jgi:hypothetical protein
MLLIFLVCSKKMKELKLFVKSNVTLLIVLASILCVSLAMLNTCIYILNI